VSSLLARKLIENTKVNHKKTRLSTGLLLS